jgi:hypothetical protein
MKEYAREMMAFGIVALFTFAFVQNPKEQLMVGAIIAAFSTAYGFYLGGSKVGSDTATKNADTVAANASAALAGPTDVNVVNTPSEPVPTTPGEPA